LTQFVLVPGEWLGGWVWRKVRVRLEAAGHSVATPTLTGLGERSHLAGRWIGLETHIADVANVIEREGLDDLVLVGQGYAGLVATAVADRLTSRVARLVLVGSTIPRHGCSLFDVSSPRLHEGVEADVGRNGDRRGWPIPPPDELGRWLSVADMTHEDREWLWGNAAPHPVRTMREPLRLTGAAEEIPTTYVRCLADEALVGVAPMTPAGWDVRTIRTGQWPMVTRPDELTDILREAADMACPLPQSMAMMR
jgi:pimeloyl-ACP methyl ester carboxylesterase